MIDKKGHMRDNDKQNQQATEPTMVICNKGEKGEYFVDDVTATCAQCGTVIHHRPSVPEDAMKVCIDCGLEVMEKTNNFDITTTPEQLREVLGALKETKKGD